MLGMSERSDVVIQRTYAREISDGIFENWHQIADRVRGHQKWLWERALGRELNEVENAELDEFIKLVKDKKACTSGRTLWMAGQDIGKKREASHFNCCFLKLKDVRDFVDLFYLLLQGCGVGFKPESGLLNGFMRKIPEVEIISSNRNKRGGNEHNIESWDAESKVWTIQIGDSAEAWAKSIGKILAGKYPADKLILDFSQIRGEGIRLKGYGWISSGYKPLAKAYRKITEIMNRRAGCLLNKIDILDIANHLGQTLSSRRSAQICLYDHGKPEFKELSTAKYNYWIDNPQRSSSNNSQMFWEKPSLETIRESLQMMYDAGGSEPGMINAEAASKRAPWFSGVNPCGEILLAAFGVCNLMEINLAAFRDDMTALLRAAYLVGRANYRQTLVNFKDGMLQENWHQVNEFLRLCGVGITGVAQRPDLKEFDYISLRREATHGAYSMADELGLQRPKNITTQKPSGCRPLDAITVTDKGVLTLEEILEHHPAGQEWNNIQGLNVYQGESLENQVSKSYRNGVSEVLEIKMPYGLSIQSTPNHPWFVKTKYSRASRNKYKEINQWIPAQDIRPGDMIEVNTSSYRKQTSSSLAPISSEDFSNQTEDIKCPEKMDTDLAWLIGYFYGDGCLSEHQYRVRICDSNLDCLLKAQRIFKDKFGLNRNIGQMREYKKAHEISVSSRQLYQWFKLNGIDKSDGIPKVIRQSSREDIISFFAGIFDADGCFHKHSTGRSIRATLSTAYDDKAQMLQQVSWAVGLCLGKSLNTQGDNKQAKKNIWLMTISSYVEQSTLDVFKYNSIKYKQALDKGLYEMVFGKTGRKNIQVLDVISVGEKVTADIEVDKEHWYYAGAFKSHNTLSKVFECTEGIHKPLGKYIINNIVFGKSDPLIPRLRSAGYKVSDHPRDETAYLVRFPVKYDGVEFDKVKINGQLMEVNLESAIDQLERYKMIMQNWCDQNCSITVSYDESELEDIANWMYNNWDSYVGVSFILRNDPTKTAQDLGHDYLPQEVVTEQQYLNEMKHITKIDFNNTGSYEQIDSGDECSTGACPIK